MRLLTKKQQRFVIAMLEMPNADQTGAARVAGYSDPGNSSIRAVGHAVAHNPRVQAAIQEEARKRMNSAAILAVSNLIGLAADPTNKAIQLKASIALMNRVGLHEKTESHNIVEHRDGTDQMAIEKIMSLAGMLGVDAKTLLGKAGYKVPDREVIDVTPEDGLPTLDGLEDIL